MPTQCQDLLSAGSIPDDSRFGLRFRSGYVCRLQRNHGGYGATMFYESQRAEVAEAVP